MPAITEATRREILLTYDRGRARKKWEDYKMTFFMITVGGAVATIMYAPFAFVAIYLALITYYLNIYREFFENPQKKALYEYKLMPLMSRKYFFQIGVEIYEDEFYQKITDMERGIYDQEEKKKRYPYRIVGISRNQLTTHFWILGTTGAGKTSLLMTIFQEHIKRGGGFVFIDGKSDIKMFKKLYSIAKEAGREHQVFLLNFLTPEKKTDSNTYGGFSTLPPNQGVEFLSSLQGEPTGDQVYWQGRGIVLLRPIMLFNGLRREFWGENYSYETIKNYLQPKEFHFLAIVVTLLMRDLENKLSLSRELKPVLEEARGMAVPSSNFPNTELIRTYVIQKPQERAKIEAVGFNVSYIEQLYQIYSLALQYASGIYGAWGEAIHEVAETFYKVLFEDGYELEKLSMEDIRKIFREKRKDMEERMGIQQDDQNPIDYVDYMPPNAVQQFQYSSQMWENTMSIFEVFSHIFGSLDPDIDMEDVLKNNRILYVLLPPLQQSKNTVEILGRSIISSIRQATSVALGDNVEYSLVQDEIIKDRITPKPVFLVVADEYGAYPVEGIDIILAQVRSINISFFLSTQDYVSAKARDKETPVERAWANTQKIILKIRDNKTKENLSQALGEVKYQTFKKYDYGYYTAEDIDVQIETEKLVDPKMIEAFRDGVGMIITDGIRPTIFHAFWADPPEAEEVRLTRLEKVA